jgi:thiamine-monophosphate kinase
MKSDCAHFRVALIGGDTVETPGPLTLVMTAFGKTAAESAILRSNARSGDDIWVSGTIGDAVLGLVVAQGGTIHGLDPADAAWLLDRYRLPQPRIDLGLALVGLVHSGMDISDGLVGDLGHLSAVSRLAAVVDVDAVPLSAAARRALCLQGAPGLGDLITGGDDYELLFTAPPEQQASIVAQSQACGVPVARIGHMSEGEGVRVVDAQGQAIMLAQTGYRHFTGGTR